MSGGSSAPAAPTQQTVTQTNVPDYARPYVEDMLGRTQALTDTNQNPYQTYGGPRVANATADQGRAYSMADNMQVSPQIGQATGMASDVYGRAAGIGSYNPGTFSNQTVSATPGFQRVGTDTWNQGAAQQYMDPYMQSVVDIEKREAARQSAMQQQQNGANAVEAGAFGGTRDALVEAERERNLAQQMGDIQAKGSDAAYTQGLQAFQADRARQLQAGMANQGAGLTWGQQYLQGQMANQGADLQRQQLGEQSRQFGAGLGMQGLQTQLGAANLMQTLGQNQYNQQVGIAGLLDQFGREQQMTNQQGIDAAYQDWVNRQMYPYRQLDFENQIVHGNYSPNTTSSVYGGYGSPASQMAGLATAGYGLSKMMAEGGQVQDVSYKDIPDARASYQQHSVMHYGAPEPAHYASSTHAAEEYSGHSYPQATNVYPTSGPDEDLVGLPGLMIAQIQ